MILLSLACDIAVVFNLNIQANEDFKVKKMVMFPYKYTYISLKTTLFTEYIFYKKKKIWI